ncbi:unnamed protein product [Dicrocoelium dendriticum]|nr:unnamed protein product [Dicrocoelium dendriticum]
MFLPASENQFKYSIIRWKPLCLDCLLPCCAGLFVTQGKEGKENETPGPASPGAGGSIYRPFDLTCKYYGLKILA